MDTKNTQRVKRSYEKPKLRVIDLAAEEVLSVGCKLQSGGIASGSVINCVSSSCSAPGS